MITVAAICKNEEALIEPWIDILNHSGLVEKILILDTGSTDKTIKKINNKKVKLYQQEWHGDFSTPRNFLIKEAKNINTNFFWMLDIDEIPSKNLINFLKTQAESLNNFDLVMFPYIEFWEFDQPCFRNLPKKTALFNDFIYYEQFKPNICLIKNHIEFEYKNNLHEVLDIKQNNIKSYFASKSGNQIVPLQELYQEYFISHFSFPKYKKAARINNTSFEYELGLKRLNYRKIKSAVTNNKEYTTEWAKGDKTYREIEELGKDQIEQFINIEGYNFPNLNFEKIREINYYNLVNE